MRTATQWGVYDVDVEHGHVRRVRGIAADPHPSPLGDALLDGVSHPLRIARPAIRKGWLENPGDRGRQRRGCEAFVEVPWDEALEIAASELLRVASAHGNRAIFGGSYGWASAGRFHHAPAQLHRFLNLIGGATRAVNSYSTAAAQVILPHVVDHWPRMELHQPTWDEIAAGAELVVTFGGLRLSNTQVAYGGITEHRAGDWMRRAADRGVRFVNIGPIRDDCAAFLKSRWMPVRPGTDVALMLGVAHTLAAEGLVDLEFIAGHTVGYQRFERYLMGASDGVVKNASWASSICAVPSSEIVALAREMAGHRTFINAAWSLQRADHGEQPYWMVVVLAAMLGDIGLPGGGFGFGYGAEGFIGSHWRRFDWATLPKGRNPAGFAIPVARIADMLLAPGTTVSYDGTELTYPEIRAIYWAGGNPFHHHQDLHRLVRGWRRPDVVIVNEPWWTPVARFADIVFPATTPLEREDICASSHDPYVHAMYRVLEPIGESRSDYEIFSGLARACGVAPAFTGNRTPRAWLEYLWRVSRQRAAEAGFTLPEFDVFWEAGEFRLPEGEPREVWLSGFRADPESHPLATTPSGKLEICSEVIAAFGYPDCPGHPVWLEPFERLGGSGSDRYTLHLVSNQPAHRLHSQFDHSAGSRQCKVAGRESLRMHPRAAAQRGISDGDLVRVFNDRGQTLAGVRLDDALMPEVVELPTGAWFDAMDPGNPAALELSGNPNVLTRDKGTSSLAQGPSAQTVLVEVERFRGDAPLPRVYRPPAVESR